MTDNSRKSAQRLRIIGGDWRSRVLHFSAVPDLRPTPDRVRETLFNWLQLDIAGARCLDLFAGSGILGFEALSRGAREVVALESHPQAVRAIRENCRLLETGKLQVQQVDALQWLKNEAASPFDIVFLDPPFKAGLHSECCALLQSRGWLREGSLVYLEAGEPLSRLALPDSWQARREKRAGDVHYGYFEAAAQE